MDAFPAHGHLYHAMEFAKRKRRRHQNASPHHGADTSHALTCRIALASAEGSEGVTSGTEGFGRRFIRPDYRLSARPSPDTPEILMLSKLGLNSTCL